MLTAEHVRSIPLFSRLAQPELERLAQNAADLRLAAGEFAAHEGGQERALFAVLSGRIEVVRAFDGVSGDVRLSPVKRVASAVGEGRMAIAFVHKVLQEGPR